MFILDILQLFLSFISDYSGHIRMLYLYYIFKIYMYIHLNEYVYIYKNETYAKYLQFMKIIVPISGLFIWFFI